MRYIPSSPADRKAMLAEIGLESIEDLFSSIPKELRLNRLLDLPPAHSEPELIEVFEEWAQLNRAHALSFLGAGVYPHRIPAIVDDLISRSEFYTAYTPYQPEVAQGTLQAIFEFQTYMAQLTGMDVANASLYDGSTALSEGILMAHRISGRRRFLISRTVHPEYRAVLETCSKRLGLEIELFGYLENGRIDEASLASRLGDDVGAVAIQSPNFFGTIEDTVRLAELAHGCGALAIVNIAEAASLGVLKGPGAGDSANRQADIVVGEVQSFGVHMSFGGPHVGFVASRKDYVRQLPGRLVGMGYDGAGKRAFVLTLATREQHIRRAKATSNICTNQSLCALMSTIYLAALGPVGLREIAVDNVQRAAFARRRISAETSHEILFNGSRFNEFVVRVSNFDKVWKALLSDGIVPGVPLGRFYPELDGTLLVCVTETHSIEHIDRLVRGMAA